MNLTRLKELSAAGYPVALAPEQMLELLNELEALRDHRNQLLSLIYNSAEGELCMGYKSDIESMARDAFSITGLSASDVRGALTEDSTKWLESIKEVKIKAGQDGYQACIDALIDAATNALDNGDDTLNKVIAELDTFSNVLQSGPYAAQLREALSN